MINRIAAVLLAAGACLAQQPDNMVFFQHAASGAAIQKFYVNIEDAGPLLGGHLVAGKPFTAQATTESVQMLADGNRIVNTTTTDLARDSKGRTRREDSLGGLVPLTGVESKKIVFIDDPASKTSYILDPETKTARKSSTSRDAAAEKMHHEMLSLAGAAGGPTTGAIVIRPGSLEQAAVEKVRAEAHEQAIVVSHTTTASGSASAEHAQVESLGTRTIEGILAEGTRRTTTIPAGTFGNERPISIVSERWYSPELQTVVLSTRKDPRMGETTFKLTQINRAEPPAALFEVPADYQVSEGPFMFRKEVRTPEAK